MLAYAYPITINYGKQKVQSNHKALLPDNAMTVEQLKEIVGNNSFTFGTEDEHFWTNTYVYWTAYRDETNEEQKARIAKEEAYMAEYEKRKKAKNG